MKKIVYSLSTILLFSVTGFASAEKYKTMEECAQLLPSNGKQYKVSIIGNVSDKKEFKGKLAITDNTEKPLTVEETKATEAFVGCVTKLIK